MNACLLIWEDDMCLLVPFSNGRREGANPSSRVTVLQDLEFLNQSRRPVNLCLNQGFRSLVQKHVSRVINHTRTEKIGGDSIYFCGHPSRAGNRYDSLATPLGSQRVKPIFCHMLSSVIIRMLSLSIVSIWYCFRMGVVRVVIFPHA